MNQLCLVELCATQDTDTWGTIPVNFILTSSDIKTFLIFCIAEIAFIISFCSGLGAERLLPG